MFSTVLASSQCMQEKKANEYKVKAKNTPKHELKKKSAFLQLSKYYEYVCECNNGTSREKELIMLINRLVDVNKSYHLEKYGALDKVYKCKTLKNNHP